MLSIRNGDENGRNLAIGSYGVTVIGSHDWATTINTATTRLSRARAAFANVRNREFGRFDGGFGGNINGVLTLVGVFWRPTFSDISLSSPYWWN